jgi:hypothetical protein
MKNAMFSVVMIVLISLLTTPRLLAHCDSLGGPVIKDAQRALESNDVTPVLKWVAAKDEDSIKKIFELTTAVRGKGQEVQQIADSYFFETLVRVHRASEGEGFTGLKPKGSVEPAIAATDLALTEGNINQLAEKIASAVREGILSRFNDAYKKKLVADDSVAEGREYVESYVQLTHFIEAIHHTVLHGASHKHQDAE